MIRLRLKTHQRLNRTLYNYTKQDTMQKVKQNENTQEIKRTLFNQTKQDKTCKFSRKSSFSSYVLQNNNNKRTINNTENKQLIWLVLCQLNVGSWRKEKSTRLTDVIKKRAWRKLYDAISRWRQKKRQKEHQKIEEEKRSGRKIELNILQEKA